MLAASILGEDRSQRLRIEAVRLQLVQRQPFGAYLRVIRQVSVSNYRSIFEGAGEHELDAVLVGIGFGEFVVSANVFAYANQVSDSDVYGDFLAALALDSGGKRLPRLLPTARQDIESSFIIQVFSGKDMVIDDDDGFSGIPNCFHRVLLSQPAE